MNASLTFKSLKLKNGALSAALTSLQCGHLLQSITNAKSHRKGRQLHGHMISSGVLLDNTYLSTKLSTMYAIFGDLSEARMLFDGIVLKNSFLWNAMIRGYACNGRSLDSLVLYREMLEFGRRPDNFTYPFVLMACGDLLLVEIGRMIHCEIILSGYESDVYVGNSLLSMYSKFGDMGIARKLFDKMPERDLTSWNTVISGYAKNGDPGSALLAFSAIAKGGERFDRATILSVLPACADPVVLKKAKEIHAYILRGCMERDGILMNSLINIYMNSDFIIGAKRLFKNMSRRDTVSWNSMISGCARHGDAIESLIFFHRMNAEGSVLDIFTVTAVLGACDRIAALQFGRSLHSYVTIKGLDKSIIVGTALINMYAKCGSLGCSQQVFGEMTVKNLISWSAMVSGYGLHGRGREAVACYGEMKAEGIKPDKITFTSVLSACSHTGLVEEGKEIFSEMSNEYSIKPSVEQCSCMVDLLGRAGLLDEAYRFIMIMEVEPDVDVWAALLSACCVHRNVELAEIAAQNALDLNPKCVGVYVSLSNIYSMERRWGDVERVRGEARRIGLKKPPGCSFVELDMAIHRFLVGDRSHPQS